MGRPLCGFSVGGVRRRHLIPGQEVGHGGRMSNPSGRIGNPAYKEQGHPEGWRCVTESFSEAARRAYLSSTLAFVIHFLPSFSSIVPVTVASFLVLAGPTLPW